MVTLNSTNLGAIGLLRLGNRLTGRRLDPYRACSFIVDVEGLVVGGFSSISGLEVETQSYDYQEGGRNEFTHRFVGPTQHPPLVFTRGLSPLDGLWAWHQDIVNGKVERRNGTIYLLARTQLPVPVMWWNFTNALPMKWTGPELRAESSGVAFESVELTHHGLIRPTLKSVLTGLGIDISF